MKIGGPCRNLGSRGCTLKRGEMPIECVSFMGCKNSVSVGKSDYSYAMWESSAGREVIRLFEEQATLPTGEQAVAAQDAAFENDDKACFDAMFDMISKTQGQGLEVLMRLVYEDLNTFQRFSEHVSQKDSSQMNTEEKKVYDVIMSFKKLSDLKIL